LKHLLLVGSLLLVIELAPKLAEELADLAEGGLGVGGLDFGALLRAEIDVGAEMGKEKGE